MAHAMRAIAHLRAVRGPGALSIPPSVTAERARTIPAAIRPFSSAHSRASRPAFTSPASSAPLRPGTRLLQQKLTGNPQFTTRSFSVVSYFDMAISTTQDYLLFLHSSLGIPWYLTIPLFAISLNMLFRLPTRLYIQDIIQRRNRLKPLFEAFMLHGLHRRDRGKNYKLDESLKMMPDVAFKAHERFEKRWKLQNWRILAAQLAGFPLWLLGIEAIRRQSTATGGLLGIILDLFREKKVTGEVDPVELANSAIKRIPLESPVLDNTLNEAISHAGQVAGQNIVSTAATTAPPAMEGILWIPDLALADPYHILPFALSAALVANAMPRDRKQWGKLLGTMPIDTDDRMPWKAQFRQRLMLTGMRMNLLFSVVVGPLTMGLPAAMHLYWITTTLVSPILRYLVNWLRPVHPRYEFLHTRHESHMVYPMPQERKKPVAESTTATRPVPTATPVTKRTTTTIKPTATAPPAKTTSTPAKPTSRFAAQGGKKEKATKR
ncbi:hypothetical protein QBC36DRAFT_331073 [Triangularia setosa]|uniref:Uncharacterized protein n=1 Tax=Triangularia setosa TaxID=2587417 RepID=A0AAN7A523_9PEZI|nr:hypothetical protein QBC36DRAFT_331073 [Podospora setosa]